MKQFSINEIKEWAGLTHRVVIQQGRRFFLRNYDGTVSMPLTAQAFRRGCSQIMHMEEFVPGLPKKCRKKSITEKNHE